MAFTLKSAPIWADIRDFGGVSGESCGPVVQAIVDALAPEGGIIYFPPGAWTIEGVMTKAPLNFHFDDKCVISIVGCAFLGGTYDDRPFVDVGPLLIDPSNRLLKILKPVPPPRPAPLMLVAPIRSGRYIEL